MTGSTRALLHASTAFMMATLAAVSPGRAQDVAPGTAQPAPADQAQGAADALAEDIIVTATKRAERSQDVPLALTAYGADQLAALSFRDLGSLSTAMPNVQLEDVGTVPGIANFSIRGLGINSSIPSIDPTVGVFVDGVYMGINAGVLFDNFDIEAIEVLRGPQGVLFGRNVTGGAVLVRTSRPSFDLKMNTRVSVETGPLYTVDGSISGPIAGEVLAAKLAVYHSDDAGWFVNDFDGSEFGEAKQTIIRGALLFNPAPEFELLLRLEHGEGDGDGPAAQNHALFSRDSFDFAINERGLVDHRWNQAFLESNVDVPFGDGTVTAILGWREYRQRSLSDVDSTPGAPPFNATALFPIGLHTSALIDQDQLSGELRYAGSFGPVELTTGGYYFEQDVFYIESRRQFNGLFTGGGDGDFSTWGAFAAIDWEIVDSLTLNAGIRYTEEEKSVVVSQIRAGGGDIGTGTIVPNFVSSDSWNDVSPRIGLQWRPAPDTQIYGYWAKGFRSGGYNFRSTSATVPPGPFDSEEQNSFELGVKSDLFDRALRLNAALFHNEIKGIQREINFPDPVSVVTQVIRNVGDVTLKGFELEATWFVSSNLVLSGMAGYTDGDYDSLIFDLNGDGAINQADFALELPRLAPWTYGGAVTWDLELLDDLTMSTRVSFNHRDANFFTDNNRGRLNAVDILDVNIAFTPADSPLRVAFYAQNLLNEASFGGDTPLPDVSPVGGDGAGPRPTPTFSPLNKGRVYGVEARLSF